MIDGISKHAAIKDNDANYQHGMEEVSARRSGRLVHSRQLRSRVKDQAVKNARRARGFSG